MKCASLLLLLTMMGLTLGGCGARPDGFALYLLVDDRPGTALTGTDLAGLPLRDPRVLRAMEQAGRLR